MSDIDRLQTTGPAARADHDVPGSSWSKKQSVLDNLTGVAQENPVATALITVGALWLFAGGSRLSLFDLVTGAAGTAAAGTARAGSAAASVTGDLGRTVGRSGAAAADAVREHSSAVLRQAAQAGSSVTDAAGKVASQAADAASSAYAVASDGIGRAAQKTWDAAQALPAAVTGGGDGPGPHSTALTEHLERQPLLLGAIGTIIGAGLAIALPTTEIENRAVGQASDEWKGQVQDLASQQLGRAIRTAEAALEEGKRAAEAEGLTPSAATDAVRGLGDKVRNVVGSAGTAARGSASSGTSNS